MDLNLSSAALSPDSYLDDIVVPASDRLALSAYLWYPD